VLSRPVSSIGERWTVNRATRVRFPDGAGPFVVIDYEILSMVISAVPLLLHVQKFQFFAKVKATSTD
jgi:hypothetical protein